MIIVGLSVFGQNPAACVLVDGVLVAFAEEERFVRVKSAYGYFPHKSLSYCLKEAGISLEEVDIVAVGWDSEKYRIQMPAFFASQWFRYGMHSSGGTYDDIVRELALWRPENIKNKIRFGLQKAGGIMSDHTEVAFVSHHLSHAASTYFCSGYEDATIVIFDGSGEDRTTTVYSGREKEISEVRNHRIPHSLGWLYAAFTAYLGFKPYENDGFVMGLASYGKVTTELREKMNTISRLLDNGNYYIDPNYTLLGDHTVHEYFSDQFISLFGKPRFAGDPIVQRHRNIAAAVQERLEQIGSSIVLDAIEKVGSSSICLAGGVALNCKMNGAISQMDEVDRLFVQPASHDAGSALGAAMITSLKNGEDPRFAMSHAKYGPQFSEKEIQEHLDSVGVSYRKKKNVNKYIAEKIATNKTVARFSGRMEVGPRALGGRSILANPITKGMGDHINNEIKRRETWRPFCPSMSEEAGDRFLVNSLESRFMTITYEVKKELRKQIPSVVHVDGTTRPQVVDKDDEEYIDLIKHVGENIGEAVVLNTSLNVKGEPIACTPFDALRCFYSSGLDVLAIENFIIEKK